MLIFGKKKCRPVTGYQIALDNCLDFMKSFELKSLFIQAFKRKLARSSVILMQDKTRRK